MDSPLKYVPGTYRITVTGTVGDTSVPFDFTVLLVDPCPTATLAHNVNYFMDLTYTLGTPIITATWGGDIATLTNTNANCGDYSIRLFYDISPGTSYTPTPPTYYPVDDVALSVNLAENCESQIACVGVFNTVYHVILVNYPDQITSSYSPDVKVFTVVDPCASSLVVTSPSPLVDATYTLRDPDHVQSWANPDSLATLSTSVTFCGDFAYTFYRIETSGNTDFASLSPNPFTVDTAAETLTVAYTEDTSLAGAYELTYQVCLANYPTSCAVYPSTFTITINDPCQPPA